MLRRYGITRMEVLCLILGLLAIIVFNQLLALIFPGAVLLAMAAVTTSNPADYADRQQTLLNKKLLKALLFNLKLAGYGLSDGYSPNGRAIRFFRPRKANLTGINIEGGTPGTNAFAPQISPGGSNITPNALGTSISEGGADSALTLTEVGIGYVDIYQAQRVGASKISDITSALDLLNTVAVYSKTMGEDAALDYDTVIRNALVNHLYNSDGSYATGDGGYFERFAGVANSGDSGTDWGSLNGLSQANGRYTRAVALGCATQLKRSKIPKIGGLYVAVTPPEVLHDIRKDDTWVQTGQYQDKQALFKDLQITLDGVAYVEANNPWIESAAYGTEYNGTDTPPVNGLTYATIFLGQDAFGCPKLNDMRAGGSPASPRITILDKPDKGDWANRNTIISWKSYYGAAPLTARGSAGSATANSIADRPRFVILRSKSTFIPF